MDDLHKKFYSIADRVQKTDVLDLPEFVHEERIIELPAKSMKIYKDLEADMIADVGAGVVTASNALSRLLRLHQITSGFTVTEDDLVVDLNTAKQDALADLLANEIEPGTPVVVFCLFRKDLAAVHMAAAEAKCQSVELSGSRHDINGTWDDGPDTVAAIQIAAGGIGIDLTRSSVNVYYSIGFNGGDYEQSLARSHRNGQTNKVTYIHFIVEDTIDRRIQLALARRASIVKDVLAQLENKL